MVKAVLAKSCPCQKLSPGEDIGFSALEIICLSCLGPVLNFWCSLQEISRSFKKLTCFSLIDREVI